MIVSASRRTDIPCFYAEWMMNRFRAGYALVRNPMNHAQLTRVPLTPDVVDCVVFWTKDAANLLPCLGELDERGYAYYFQFTLTPYDRALEPNLRGKAEIAATFRALSKRIGSRRVVWRYDPVILNDSLGVEWHKAQFERLCGQLAGYTDTVTVSFVDLYPKLKTDRIRAVLPAERAELAGFFAETAREHGLRAAACCEAGDLRPYGLERASCIDRARIEALLGCRLDTPPDKNQRAGCGCCRSVDIGAYNTCGNGCVYCYANHSAASARKNLAAHRPDGELLFGEALPGEKITERRFVSEAVRQSGLPGL